MKIETGKYYRTRDGHKVLIYATDGRDEWVHGAVLLDDGWQADGGKTWLPCGVEE